VPRQGGSLSSKMNQEPPRKKQPGEVVEPYVPNKSDPVDMELARILNSFNSDFIFPKDFKRVAPGQYTFHSVKVHLRFINGHVVVRVGGGWMALFEYLTKYAKDAESAYGQTKDIESGKEWNSLVIEKAH